MAIFVFTTFISDVKISKHLWKAFFSLTIDHMKLVKSQLLRKMHEILVIYICNFILYVTLCRQSYACINEKMSHRVLDWVGHSWLIISCEIFATACMLFNSTQNNDHIFERDGNINTG